ncbi:MAG: hypothetical protein ACJ75B_02285 [Flavisolibacter sp.]|jgi:hypothetical protein
MKKQKSYLLLVLVLLLLSAICGFLLSKPSLVGKIGIHLFYKQYRFLEIWWHGALFVFVVWMILLFGQGLLQRKLKMKQAMFVQYAMIFLALVGFYFTYRDFRDTTTHRWLKERFHIGGYLFWAGWILISIFYLTEKKQINLHEEERGDTAV